jgi:DNA gyrase subunit B
LESLARDHQIHVAISKRLSSRYDERLLDELLHTQPMDDSIAGDPLALTAWCRALEERLNTPASPSLRYSLQPRMGEHQKSGGLLLTRLVHGIPETKVVPLEFFHTADYGRIVDLGRKLQGLLEPGAFMTRGERRTELRSLGEGIDWLLAEARRGYSIQRYKGLGEMNPEQLWDTTMNPETRRLLRVTIEDAVAADQIFTTLMGDNVEPRREFIERHALDVENLDI